jgi:hypothetical protein
MIWALVGLLLPAGAVSLCLRALTFRTAADSHALTAAIAFCVGLGLSSLVTFLWAVLSGGIGPWFAVADAVLWTAIGIAGWVSLARTGRHPAIATGSIHGRRGGPSGPPDAVSHVLVRGVFLLLAVIVIAAAYTEYRESPYGQIDATLIWNLKARFMIRGGDAWTDFVHVARSNPSHPMLVPASVARLWAYAGSESPLIAAGLGFAVGAAIVAAVVGALGVRRTRAWIAACVLIAPWTFGESLVAQTADLPFALYVLVTLIVVLRYADAGSGDMRRWLLLAGMLAGLVAWTKNEGLVFLAITLTIAAWLVARAEGIRRLWWFLAGAAPALIALAWLKLAVAPVPPEYFAGAPGLAIAGTPPMGWARLALLPGLLWQHAVQWGGPAAAGTLPVAALAAVVVACTRKGMAARTMLGVLIVMFAAYCAAWLVSPLDTAWLVGQTFPRLLLHLWPSLVLAAFSYGAATGADATLSSAPRPAPERLA